MINMHICIMVMFISCAAQCNITQWANLFVFRIESLIQICLIFKSFLKGSMIVYNRMNKRFSTFVLILLQYV